MVTDILTRFWEHLGGRIGGPMSFRLVIQPAVAIALAYVSGKADARAGLPPYFTGMFTDPSHRRAMLRDGWKAVAKVFVATIAIDVIYQIIVFRWVYPNEALVVAVILACIPYVIVRGAVNRVLRARRPPKREEP